MTIIKIGSCFSGIGGFELGFQWALDEYQIDHEVTWQIEENKFCQSILKKHWPSSKLYSDIREVNNLEPVDILIGGFPCTDISYAGKQAGLINGKKSGLWFEMLRIISDIRPRIICLENVPAIIRVGGTRVIGDLAQIGYDCEWKLISAWQFGAPHIRKRWFCVAYSNNTAESTMSRHGKMERLQKPPKFSAPNTSREQYDVREYRRFLEKKIRRESSHPKAISCSANAGSSSNTNSERTQISFERKQPSKQMSGGKSKIRTFWTASKVESPLCSMDDGFPNRVARLKALGNAIVPQCSAHIAECIIRSGLIP